VTYIRSLPQSPIYNAAKAREDFRELDRRDWQSLQLHPQSLFLRQSLETFDELSGQIQELARANASLREDLRKREEAIKRLRELTLGQTGAKP
jgi:hypothetical protein